MTWPGRLTYGCRRAPSKNTASAVARALGVYVRVRIRSARRYGRSAAVGVDAQGVGGGGQQTLNRTAAHHHSPLRGLFGCVTYQSYRGVCWLGEAITGCCKQLAERFAFSNQGPSTLGGRRLGGGRPSDDRRSRSPCCLLTGSRRELCPADEAGRRLRGSVRGGVSGR
jgi:hypothetical protein